MSVMPHTPHVSYDGTGSDHELDDFYLHEDHIDYLALLPPEICERICQLLPSQSLYCLPTISDKLRLTVEKEMNIRHSQLKEKVLIFQSSSLQSIYNSVSMLCPGLVLLYSSTNSSTTDSTTDSATDSTTDSTTSPLPPHHTHTIYIQLTKSLFTSTSYQTCQTLSVPHFSTTTARDTSNTSATSPSCYELLSLPLSDPATSVLMFFIPVDHPNVQKVGTFSSWNICHKSGLSSLRGKSSLSKISIPRDYEKAQLVLGRELLGNEPDLSLLDLLDPLPDPSNMYKDPTTLVLVVTDSESDPVIQLALQTFFAKIFLPLRVSWVKMVEDTALSFEVGGEDIEDEAKEDKAEMNF